MSVWTGDICLGGHGEVTIRSQARDSARTILETGVASTGGRDNLKKALTTSRILGQGGLIHQSICASPMSSASSQIPVYRFLVNRGLGHVWHFEWAFNGGSGLSEQDKAEYVATMSYMAEAYDSVFRVTDICLGREDEDDLLEDGGAAKYLEDFAWFIGQMQSRLPGVRIWGPSVATRSNGRDVTAIQAVIDAGDYPSAAQGYDIHAYRSGIMIPTGDNQDTFFESLALVRAQGLGAIAMEFGGGTWGIVTHWGDTYYSDGTAQAYTMASNIMMALGYGMSKIFHSHFPWDTTWDYTDLASIHNHTGLCVGEREAGESWDNAGAWREAAYWYQWLCNMMRDYRVQVPGTAMDSGEDYSELLAFECVYEGEAAKLYVVLMTEEARPPNDVDLTLGSSKVYVVGDIQTQTWTESTYDVSTLPVTPGWVPQFIIVPGV